MCDAIRWICAGAALTVAALSPTGPASGQPTDPAEAPQIIEEILGADGTLYSLRSDSAGPADSGTTRELVLEVMHPDGSVTSHMVPGTDDDDLERWPNLSYSQSRGSISVVWEHLHNLVNSTINIAEFADGEWVNDHEIMGGYWAAKNRPQLVVTAETDQGDADASAETVQTTHLVWRENQGQVFYVPIVDAAGGRSAIPRPFSLSEIFPDLFPAYAEESVDAPLVVRQGRNSRTLVVGVVDPIQQTLDLVEIATLPLNISRLADAGFDSVEDGAEDGDTLVAVAEEARSHIVFIGRNGPVAPIMADAAASTIRGSEESWNQGDWVAVAEAARSHIVFIGLTIEPGADGNRPVTALRAELSTEPDARNHTTDISFRHLRRVALPGQLPSDSELLVSATGSSALIYWPTVTDGASGFSYLELHMDGDWGEERTLTSRQGLSQERALELIKGRLQH